LFVESTLRSFGMFTRSALPAYLVKMNVDALRAAAARTVSAARSAPARLIGEVAHVQMRREFSNNTPY
jgi:hypothetical protein